jgi:nitroreductase
MDVIEALNSRHSVRAFQPDAPDRDVLVEIFTAAGRAPSWANTQPWEVFVAAGSIVEEIRQTYATNFKNSVPRNPELAIPRDWPDALEQRMAVLRDERIKSLGGETDNEAVRKVFFELNVRLFKAPVIAYICMDRTLTPWSIYDLGLFSQSLMLAAQGHGVASIPAFNLVAYPSVLRDILEIPHELTILMGIALGYEDSGDPNNQYRSPRRTVEDFVRFKGI